MNLLLKSFRVVSYLEGISFLLLLGIAMPLKYMFDLPMYVTVTGMAHGVLFVLYIIAVIVMMIAFRWSWSKGLLAMVASVIPFGPFIFDAKLLKSDETSAKTI
ncbi:DUF3817 domain-containing protein [Halalkalibacter nanhaiisediminis]|uniref:Integral membrane protein n=1 Tax=Halalkalibacter nanhaiisediminis TaxID=688079 RepID=A0A562QSM6_9BACI|nr:DUF3817 domain-containing protein [Halalkalibacter nanhaiisediminis]TWI59697.1 integral membrane protein [Halalkalibacter nanhaiisediminis]